MAKENEAKGSLQNNCLSVSLFSPWTCGWRKKLKELFCTCRVAAAAHYASQWCQSCRKFTPFPLADVYTSNLAQCSLQQCPLSVLVASIVSAKQRPWNPRNMHSEFDVLFFTLLFGDSLLFLLFSMGLTKTARRVNLTPFAQSLNSAGVFGDAFLKCTKL